MDAPDHQNTQEKLGRRFTLPFQKVPDHEWPAIRTMAEQGMSYREIGAKFGVTKDCIRKRATKEKWVTKARLKAAHRGELSPIDPATLVNAMWQDRSASAREQVYQGAKKALDRFFAMAPIPQSFAEAATAAKLMNESINPGGAIAQTNNVSVQILSTQGFEPRPVVDV